jgi:hypothetical protein
MSQIGSPPFIFFRQAAVVAGLCYATSNVTSHSHGETVVLISRSGYARPESKHSRCVLLS